MGPAGIFREIGSVLMDCQATTSNHRKNVKIMTRLLHGGRGSLEEEQQFLFTFIRHINHVLCVKRDEPWSDKLVKFVQAFLSQDSSNSTQTYIYIYIYMRGHSVVFTCLQERRQIY